MASCAEALQTSPCQRIEFRISHGEDTGDGECIGPVGGDDAFSKPSCERDQLKLIHFRGRIMDGLYRNKIVPRLCSSSAALAGGGSYRPLENEV